MATVQETEGQTDVPELIPARMLNEYTYCPRLAYLEWVQGEFVDNLETIEGRFGHRRVDKRSNSTVPDGSETNGNGKPQVDEEETSQTIHTRSLMLSAPGEGLIAKMDVVDINANTAVPVDYKRGHIPNIYERAWEPERVQVCAQGLILCENGFQCDEGILYFVESKRRVTVPFDEELVARTRQLVEEMRRMAADGIMPMPLDNSEKCRRCSLVGICLPDETCFLAGKESTPRKRADDVRRLVPARDDALPLYLQEQGTKLGKSGDQLTVKQHGEVVQKTKIMDVSQVAVFGNVQITAQALREITARGIPVCHFSYGGWFHATTIGMANKNVELRIAQYAIAADPARSIAFARDFVLGKIKNCRTLLRRHLDGDPENLLPRLAELANKAQTVQQAKTLLGIEGTAARLYFPAFASMLNGGDEFQLDGRNRRPPLDPINALLSFVYSLLTKELTIALYASGFDPMLGFYHRPRYGRPSLALDLAEEFRPLIADSVVLTLINNGEVAAADFIRRAGGVSLTTSARRTVIGAFERRMETLVTHPIFGYRVSYRRILEVQARLLGRTVLGELEAYPSFCTR